MELKGEITTKQPLTASFDFDQADYELLFNKPSINGVELIGNKTSEDLHITGGGGGGGTTDYNDLSNKPKINGIALQDDLDSYDLDLQPWIPFPGDPTKYMDGEGNFTTPQVPGNYVKDIDVSNIVQAETQFSPGVEAQYTANEDVYIYYILYSNNGNYEIKINGVSIISNYTTSITARADHIYLRKGNTISLKTQAPGYPGSYIVYGTI